MEFSGQKYWSGWPFPLPEDLSDSEFKLRCPALQADFFFFNHLSHLSSSKLTLEAYNLSNFTRVSNSKPFELMVQLKPTPVNGL